LESCLERYEEAHERIRLDPEARGPQHWRVTELTPRKWRVEQTLVDPEEWNDWSLKLEVCLDRCDEEGRVCLVLEEISPIA